MTPQDDSGGDSIGPTDLDSVVDFAECLASLQGAPEPDGYLRRRAGHRYSDPTTVARVSEGGAGGPAVAMGLALVATQLAHALEALHRLAPVDGRPGRKGDGGTVFLPDAVEARHLVGLALTAVAGGARLGVPAGRLATEPPDEVADPELEAVFVEFDTAREAWRALPRAAETWKARPEVDHYLIAEQAVLALADARPDVLRRQASLLLDMTEEIRDQVGAPTANAIASVAQGLLLRL